MVLEQFLDRKVVTRHLPFVIALSAVYVFVAYGVQSIFFPNQSLAAVLLVTILLLPSLHHLIILEEQIERGGSSHVWRRHKTIVKCYLGTFLGLLLGFLILGFINSGALQYQAAQIEQEHLRPEAITGFVAQPYTPTFTTVLALFSHNILYLLVAFALSVFYGAGSVFLLAYNASFFAVFIVEIFARWGHALSLFGVSLLHLLPEGTGYVLTAIAGATISRALIHEKVSGGEFANVLRNCVILLGAGMLAILLAAFIEVYVTAPFFHAVIG